MSRPLPARPDGLVTRAELQEAGWTEDALRAQLDSGRWRRLHRGVYVTHAGPVGWSTLVAAAALALGPDAIASHQTAAALHGLREADPDESIHVTVPAGRRVRTLRGVVIHLSRRFESLRHPNGWPPRTRVEETVLDLIDTCDSAEQVETWVMRACQRRRTTPARLAEAAARRRRLRWRAVLHSLVADVAEGAHSPLELQYLRIERAHGLPRARRQVRHAGRRVIWVDAEIPELGVRVELDGRVGHVEEGAFRDRRRDNAAAVAGEVSLRYGHAEVFGRPCEVALEVAEVSHSRGWRGCARPCGPDCALARRGSSAGLATT